MAGSSISNTTEMMMLCSNQYMSNGKKKTNLNVELPIRYITRPSIIIRMCNTIHILERHTILLHHHHHHLLSIIHISSLIALIIALMEFGNVKSAFGQIQRL
jgi:hypothetical protein